MLTFEDDLIAPAARPMMESVTPETIRAQGSGGILSREPVPLLNTHSRANLTKLVPARP